MFGYANALLLALANRTSADVSRTFGELEKIWNQYDVFGGADDE